MISSLTSISMEGCLITACSPAQRPVSTIDVPHNSSRSMKTASGEDLPTPPTNWSVSGSYVYILDRLILVSVE